MIRAGVAASNDLQHRCRNLWLFPQRRMHWREPVGPTSFWVPVLTMARFKAAKSREDDNTTRCAVEATSLAGALHDDAYRGHTTGMYSHTLDVQLFLS